MAENVCYCTYLEKSVDLGMCYDIQMIGNGFIKASALPDIEIDKEKIRNYCERCGNKKL